MKDFPKAEEDIVKQKHDGSRKQHVQKLRMLTCQVAVDALQANIINYPVRDKTDTDNDD